MNLLGYLVYFYFIHVANNALINILINLYHHCLINSVELIHRTGTTGLFTYLIICATNIL